MGEDITKDDLRQFRMLLLQDIRELLREQSSENQIPEREWLRSKEIRRIMNISPGTLQNLRITGKVRSRKVMGSYYYRKSDINKLFDEKQ